MTLSDERKAEITGNLRKAKFCSGVLPLPDAIAKLVNNDADALLAHIAELEAKVKALDDAAEMLWVVLANVSGGNWDRQDKDWQEYAARWRDNYFKTSLKYHATPPREQGEKT